MVNYKKIFPFLQYRKFISLGLLEVSFKLYLFYFSAVLGFGVGKMLRMSTKIGKSFIKICLSLVRFLPFGLAFILDCLWSLIGFIFLKNLNIKKFRPVGRDWARREAHLEIARRERAGLPLISPDLIERSRVEACLPSEEELRDFDILI